MDQADLENLLEVSAIGANGREPRVIMDHRVPPGSAVLVVGPQRMFKFTTLTETKEITGLKTGCLYVSPVTIRSSQSANKQTRR